MVAEQSESSKQISSALNNIADSLKKNEASGDDRLQVMEDKVSMIYDLLTSTMPPAGGMVSCDV